MTTAEDYEVQVICKKCHYPRKMKITAVTHKSGTQTWPIPVPSRCIYCCQIEEQEAAKQNRDTRS